MRALIRSTETKTVEVSGEGLDEINEKLAANKPEGYQLLEAPVSMAKASTVITATGTYGRRDQTREIEGATFAELQASTPEGWQLMYVLRD